VDVIMHMPHPHVLHIPIDRGAYFGSDGAFCGARLKYFVGGIALRKGAASEKEQG